MRRVVSPRVSTYSVTCHQWLRGGTVAIRILPTIWQYRCKVSFVARQSARWSSGSICRLDDERDLVDVAPAPSLSWLGRPSDRVFHCAGVSRGAVVRRAVAAADVPAGLAHAQVDPRAADR